MNSQHYRKSSRRIAIAAACTAALASSSLAAAQELDYGVREVDGEPWSYIEVIGGKELVSAPLIKPTDGYLDIGDGTGSDAYPAPVLKLSGPFAAGTVNQFFLDGAAPNSPALLVIGFSAAYTEVLGVTLVPKNELRFDLTTDASGQAKFTAYLPDSWVLDTDVFAQILVKDITGVQGIAASNAIRANGSLVGQLLEDTSRMRLLGLDLAGLDGLDESIAGEPMDPNQDYVDLLNSPVAGQAAFLWQEGFPGFFGSDEELVTLSHLSQHLMFAVEKAVPFDGRGWTANGCTSSPDFNFKSCCDTHDMCYCTGGTEADRLACDKALRDCIKGKGHPWLAKIYYRAVRKFGKSHFNFIC